MTARRNTLRPLARHERRTDGPAPFDASVWRERVHVQGVRIENGQVWVRVSAANAPATTPPHHMLTEGQTIVLECKHDPLTAPDEFDDPGAYDRLRDRIVAGKDDETDRRTWGRLGRGLV